jgi:manganese efflux pump family protein
MSVATVVVIGFGLAMDAVAVSVSSGLAKARLARGDAWQMAAVFGLFQAAMPVIGYGIGSLARSWIETYDHWIALVLLGGIGAKMLWEGWHYAPDSPRSNPFSWRPLLLTGLATSLDALAVGVTLSAIDLPIWASAGIIGLVTFVLCLPAVWLGARLGTRWAAGAEIFGGLVLIGIGVKLVLDHFHSVPA